MKEFKDVDRTELARVDGGIMVPDGYCGTPYRPGGPPIPLVNGFNPGANVRAAPSDPSAIIAILIG
jgi:hypothetical protein